MNTLEYAVLFQGKLDKQMLQVSSTGWMEANKNLVKYTGGNTVKIPKIEMDGLKDYSRSAGFGSAGDVNLTFVPYTFDKDRSNTFNLDSQDVDETNFVATAGTIMAEFQRTKVVPEVDAYRYSAIYARANGAGNVGFYTPDAETIFQQLASDISDMQDVIGESEELVVAMSFGFAKLLDQADKIVKKIDMVDFTQGGVSTKVRSLDGVPLTRIPSARFKSAYDFKTGAENGFAPSAGAVAMNYIIMAKSAIIAITKNEKPRIFDPSTNQQADGYKIDYRIYHTLIVPDNKLAGVFVSVPQSNAVVASAMTLLTANSTVDITLTGGIYEANVSMSDFSFVGTDAVALASGTLVRTSDTVVTITIATGNTGTNNVVTVEGSAQDVQATSVTAVASTV